MAWIYLNCHLAWKLDGYKVRLGAIRTEEEKKIVDCELGGFWGVCMCGMEWGTVLTARTCRHLGLAGTRVQTRT
jgi:hypothetical protein